MYAGDTIGIETHLSTVEDLKNCLIYPEVMNEDKRHDFHKRNLQEVNDAFPFQGETKYFYHKFFDFDSSYKVFYDTEETISIILRMGTGRANLITNILPEQRFTWDHN